MKYDVIVIGSGLGGLVCGYILSKNGLKVLVLEKNAQIGGCLQTFKRAGTKFDTGMHYIGSMDEGQILYRFFKYLNLLNDVKMSRLDTTGYDIISLANSSYRYASGYEAFIDGLSQSFPNNTADIMEYVRRIREIAAASPLYNLQEINTNVFIEADYIKTSINDFIASITSNKQLQSVLVANMPLYAGARDKTPTYTHALISNFYIQSAFRIVGGSDSIAESLCASIKSYGGEVFTNVEVHDIICNDEKAISVKLTDGEVFEAERFISNIHPEQTIKKLNTKLIRKAYRDRISSLENTISNFTVYIKFKENATPYMNSNYYYYCDGDDIWASNYNPQRFGNSFLYMHQSVANGQKYATSAEVIAYMSYDEVKQWAGTHIGQRGSDYEGFKQQKAELLLKKLNSQFPGIVSAIDSYYTSTPLTYCDYTATKNGSMYGILRDKNFPTQTLVSQRTKIPNLYMTGQNINSHGILGVTIGAIITCAEFIGMPSIIRQINRI